MIGITVRNPLLLIIIFAILDFIIVYCLGFGSYYLTFEVTPTIITLWFMALFSPHWRYEKDSESPYPE